MYRIGELITIASEKGASDVHLIAGLPPKCRIDGLITNLTEETLTHEDCEEYGRQLAGEDVSGILHRGQLDLSAAIAGRRIRINLFRQQGSLSAALRQTVQTSVSLTKTAKRFPVYTPSNGLWTAKSFQMSRLIRSMQKQAWPENMSLSASATAKATIPMPAPNSPLRL